MKILPIEPYYDKVFEHYTDSKIDIPFWDWIKTEYGGYQVFVKSNPTALGDKEACGLYFGEDAEATLFALRWS
jgi:hypothetical protein